MFFLCPFLTQKFSVEVPWKILYVALKRWICGVVVCLKLLVLRIGLEGPSPANNGWWWRGLNI